MADIEEWGRSAADNNQAPPNGAPEGWTGQEINDTHRETMASVARFWADAQWVDATRDLAPRGIKALVKVNGTQLSMTGVDATAYFTTGRRVRIVGTTPVEADVASSSFTGGNTVINVNRINQVDVPDNPTRIWQHLIANLGRGAFGSPILNDQEVTAEDSAGAAQSVLKVNTSDELNLGSSALKMALFGSSLVTTFTDSAIFGLGGGEFQINGATNLLFDAEKVWREGNDGAGSGLDADILRGLALEGNLQAANLLGHFKLSMQGLAPGPTSVEHLIINYGTSSVAANSTVSVSLDVAYATEHLLAICSFSDVSDLQDNAMIQPQGLNQVQIRNSSGQTRDISWLSFGY